MTGSTAASVIAVLSPPKFWGFIRHPPPGMLQGEFEQAARHSSIVSARGKMAMRSVVWGRGAVVAALSAGALALATGSASAAAAIPVTTDFGPSVYRTAHTRDGKVGVLDLRAGDSIVADCWDRGDNINNRGNVWYHTLSERYSTSTGQELFVEGWTYGAYIDGNQAFHEGTVPEC